MFFNGPGWVSRPGWAQDADKPLAGGLTVIVDTALEGRKNMVCGANKLDYHLRNVAPGCDFTWTLPPTSAA